MAGSRELVAQVVDAVGDAVAGTVVIIASAVTVPGLFERDFEAWGWRG